jgi:competence protein ComGC
MRQQPPRRSRVFTIVSVLIVVLVVASMLLSSVISLAGIR